MKTPVNGQAIDSILEKINALRELIDERDKRYTVQFDGQEKAVSVALLSQEKAVAKAEDAQRAYNEKSNEFRASLDDAQKLMLSRTEADQRFISLERRVEDFKNTVETKFDDAKASQKQTGQWGIGIWILATGVVVAIISLVIPHIH